MAPTQSDDTPPELSSLSLGCPHRDGWRQHQRSV